ncbi:MAG TPA: efflux RND transporter periplasmic adaptor subunit [Bryobacteraceae bacterium]|nr:efflux RND transporter periplasmic adaptor subunit [Bryobacteraceae bacterium]
MNRKWKPILILVLLLAIAGGVYASIKWNQRGIVTVQTSRAVRQDLTSIVTASGEIKPKNYITIGANAQGIITALLVKEGDHVKKGEVVARIESIQAKADVEAQKAALNSALSDSAAAEDGLKVMDDTVATARATLEKTKAQADISRLNWQRSKELYDSKLIAQQDYEAKKADYAQQQAAVREDEARLKQAIAQRAQAAAQLTSAQRHIAQMEATLDRYSDVLAKHEALAPLDGVVTDLPVRVGETVVQGVQNSAASTIMTIADMSLITAEVKVDETDIVNVQLNQIANVSIDAIPNRVFQGHVIEIGNTAILRSTGVAASQSATSSQEAKDFKVVIALDNPPEEIRPGLSCEGRITTATRQNVTTIPIQALTVRQKGDLETPPGGSKSVQAAAPVDPAAEKAKRVEVQGVFVINGDRAEFRKLETGITGATDIEVLSGLKPGDEIVTGSYKVIRTLRNGARIKVDNKAPVIAAGAA